MSSPPTSKRVKQATLQDAELLLASREQPPRPSATPEDQEEDDADSITSAPDAAETALVASRHPHKCVLRLPFADPKCARIAMEVLQVDQEITPEKSTRVLTVEGSELVAVFTADTARMLKLTTTSFCDMSMVVARMMCEFAEEASA